MGASGLRPQPDNPRLFPGRGSRNRFPIFDLRDTEGLAKEVTEAVVFGFRAKAAVHPIQIQTINEALTPSAASISHARAVLAAAKSGVGTVEGKMVDEATARKARQVLAAAR